MPATSKIKKVHFIGIGESGMGAVAQLAKVRAMVVSGCDKMDSVNIYRLKKDGIDVHIGYDTEHLSNQETLIYSSSILTGKDVIAEVELAKKKDSALLLEEFIAKVLMNDMSVIAVAGTHGKETTTGMIGYVLEQMGLDPTCILGSNLLNWGKRSYRLGAGQYFVCDADHYQNKFHHYKPSILIITNIEFDHPDFFPSFDDMLNSYKTLIEKMENSSALILNKEDKGCVMLAKLINGKFKGKILWYGNLSKAQFDYKLPHPGEHVKLHALACETVASLLKLDKQKVKNALDNFAGLERRFEFKGDLEGIKIYDDYAHHPTAVAANIVAAREQFPSKKIWIVFQPNTYSRLKAFFNDFVRALDLADRVLITDVFSVREYDLNKPTGKELAQAIGEKATYVGGELINVVKFIHRNASKNILVIVMGAGDSHLVAEGLADANMLEQ